MVQDNKQYTGNCAKCDDNCLTCVDTPKNCLSCKPGFVLSVANFCMDELKIKYRIRFDLEFLLFSKKLKSIREAMNKIAKHN